MPCDHPGVGIEAAAGGKADDKSNRLSLIKLFGNCFGRGADKDQLNHHRYDREPDIPLHKNPPFEAIFRVKSPANPSTRRRETVG
jgi:hypothetical protein